MTFKRLLIMDRFQVNSREAQMHILDQAVAQLEVLSDCARVSQDSWSAYVIQEAQQIILEVLVASRPINVLQRKTDAADNIIYLQSAETEAKYSLGNDVLQIEPELTV